MQSTTVVVCVCPSRVGGLVGSASEGRSRRDDFEFEELGPGFGAPQHSHSIAELRGTIHLRAREMAAGAPTPAGGAAAAAAQVLVWHRAEATAEAKLRAVWHACLLRHHHAAWTKPPDADAATATATAATVATRPLDELHALAHASWPHALEAMRRSGWDVGRVYLDGDGACLEPG